MIIKDEIAPKIKAEARLLDNGTLWVTADEWDKVNRVIVEDGKTYCRTFYMDGDDVVEVVRCRECKYQSKGENESESWNLCGFRPWLYVPTSDDHFCSYGERGEAE